MQYFDEPIIETLADAIVIPVEVGGRIMPGSIHEQFVQNCTKEYLAIYHSVVKPCMVPGAIRSLHVKEGRWNGVWFLHFPVSPMMRIEQYTSSMNKVFNIVRSGDIEQVAIPKLGTLPWELQKYLISEFEMSHFCDTDSEVWLYTPGEDFNDEEDEEDDKFVDDVLVGMVKPR